MSEKLKVNLIEKKSKRIYEGWRHAGGGGGGRFLVITTNLINFSTVPPTYLKRQSKIVLILFEMESCPSPPLSSSLSYSNSTSFSNSVVIVQIVKAEPAFFDIVLVFLIVLVD